MSAPLGQSALRVMQFAKVPQLGKVKTRLAKSIGDLAAYEAHCQLIRYGLSAWRESPAGQESWGFELWWDQAPTPEHRQLFEQGGRVAGVVEKVQSEGDLGAKMANALAGAILSGCCAALIVGSDCPSVDSAYLSEAFQQLKKVDLVLGPAEDGGYVLIGCSSSINPGMLNPLLTGIQWGTDRVLSQTIQNAEEIGVSCAQLDTRWDVDEESDWLRFQEEVTKRHHQPV